MVPRRRRDTEWPSRRVEPVHGGFAGLKDSTVNASFASDSLVTAADRSARMPRRRFGTEITHCLTRSDGMTRSARCVQRDHLGS